MDDVAAQRLGIADPQRPAACRLDLGRTRRADAAPIHVVFGAGINADHRPDQVIMRHDRKERRPDDIEDRQIVAAIERLDMAELWLADPLQHCLRLGDRPCDNLAHQLVAGVLRHGGATIGNELVEFEHGSPPPSDGGDRVGRRADRARQAQRRRGQQEP